MFLMGAKFETNRKNENYSETNLLQELQLTKVNLSEQFWIEERIPVVTM